MQTEVVLGWVLSVVGVFPLIASGILFLFKLPKAVQTMEHVGYPNQVLAPFGILKITIAALTLVPPTSFIGVILATGWMGGAIAAHVRVGDKYVTPTVLGILIWVGYGLRHQVEMRALLGF